MKLLITKFQNKSFLQGAVNCWLRYILAQPIDIDLRIVFLFTFQLVGINRVGELMEEARLMIGNFPKIQFDGMLVLEKV